MLGQRSELAVRQGHVNKIVKDYYLLLIASSSEDEARTNKVKKNKLPFLLLQESQCTLLLLEFSVLPRSTAEAQEKIWQKANHGREQKTKCSPVRTDQFSSGK